MKTYTFILPFFIVISMFFSASLHSQEQVDVGIFESVASDTFYIKARPTYTIAGLSMTNAQLTLKWEESSGVTALTWLGTSIGLIPQGDPVIADGYYYQVYASFGGSSLNWTQGEEYLILTVAPDDLNFNCSRFEIAEDDWTAANNGDYYFEVIGEDRTGIRYEPYLNYGSEGGYVTGDTNIYLGASTGTMALEEFNGTILTWQRRYNQGGWLDIPGTAGLESFEESPSPDGIYQYRSEVQRETCPPSFSSPATVVVELLAVWTGGQDTVWENFDNWNVVGVPDLVTDALIPQVATGHYPSISLEAFTKKLTLDPGTSVTIHPSGEMTLAGDLVNEGMMLIRSDETGTGSLVNEGEVTGDGMFIHQIAYQPYAWHQVSSPVKGEIASSFTGLDLHRWEEATTSWIPVNNPGDTLESFSGYRLQATTPGLLISEFSGEAFHTGIYVSSLTNSSAPDAHTGGFNLVGNPYPSAVNWNAGGGWVRNQVDPAIYIYNSDAGNYGTYLAEDPASSTLGVDSIIASGQGFFVHVGHEYEDGVLAVNNTARLHDHSNILKAGNERSPEPLVRLKIYQDPDSLRDEVVVRFREGAAAHFEAAQDIYDFPGREFAPMLFTRSQDTLRLAVNTYPPLINNTNIPMGFYPGQDGNFILKVEEMSNFGPDTLLFLEDLKNSTVQQISEGQELQILAFTTDDIDRFLLKFQVEPVGVPEDHNLTNFSAFLSGDCIHISSLDQHPLGRIQITNLSGQILIDRVIKDSRVSIQHNLKAGLYLLRRIYGYQEDVVKVMVSQ